MAPINTGNTGHWQFMFRAADVSCGDGTSEDVAFEYPLPFIFHPDASTNLRLISGRIVAIVCAQAEKIVSTMTDCIRDILFSSDPAVFSSDSAVFSLFGRAGFLPPLEIPGAATPQPILITTRSAVGGKGSTVLQTRPRFSARNSVSRFLEAARHFSGRLEVAR
jgi:hypothetical protein